MFSFLFFFCSPLSFSRKPVLWNTHQRAVEGNPNQGLCELRWFDWDLSALKMWKDKMLIVWSM